MASTSPILGGLLLITAGALSVAAVQVHLSHPLPFASHFFTHEWREGSAGALLMGLRHGLYCLGCCWALMALLFVAGVMNLLWVAAIAGWSCSRK